MFLDRFIHPSLKNNYDTLYKARVLKSILFIFIAILSIVNFWLLTSDNVSSVGKPFALTICLSMQLLYGFALLLVRLRGAYRTGAHMTVIMTFMGVTGGMYLSGGALYAPATSMNILPIIMAFVLISKSAGLIWTLLTLCVHVSFILLQNMGFVFPQMLSTETYMIQHLTHWLVIYSSLIGLMFVFNSLNSRLKHERDDERKKFQHLASHDPLTNLANRLQFDERLEAAIERSDLLNKNTALLYIDLDGFKPINDTYGHDAGDLVLKEVGVRLTQNLRHKDTVARLGGDEFGIILEDIYHTRSLDDIANKVITAIEQPISFLTDKPQVTASIGIALYPLHTKNKNQLMKCADHAMYIAKKNRLRYQLYTEDLEPVSTDTETPLLPV